MLQGTTNSEKIYRYLYTVYQNHYAVAGLMGNLYAESGLNPNNLQNTYERSLGHTDESYTAAVDNGSYTNFVHDSAGYGLAQWTWWSRKEGLLKLAQSKKKSIGDLEIQLEYLISEMKTSFSSVHSALLSAKSVNSASDIVLTKFESPKDQSSSVKKTRRSYGQRYYDQYAGAISATQIVASTSNSSNNVSSDHDADAYQVNDKVIVNGLIYGNGNGTGNSIEKKNATMYVVGLVSSSRYKYYIGLAATKGGARQGWANPDVLKKIGAVPESYNSTMTATAKPKSKLLSLKGDYATTVLLYMRNNAGTLSAPMTILPKGQVVTLESGEFTSFMGTKWYYVTTIYKNIKYTGFCSSNYLRKV